MCCIRRAMPAGTCAPGRFNHAGLAKGGSRPGKSGPWSFKLGFGVGLITTPCEISADYGNGKTSRPIPHTGKRN